MKKNNSLTNQYFTLDFFTEKIIGTESAFKEAGKGYGIAYEQLMGFMDAHPTYTLERVADAPKKTKGQFKGLTMDFIKDYLSYSNNPSWNVEFENVKREAASLDMNVFFAVRTWFLNNVVKENNDFKTNSIAELKSVIREKKIDGFAKNDIPTDKKATENTIVDMKKEA